MLEEAQLTIVSGDLPCPSERYYQAPDGRIIAIRLRLLDCMRSLWQLEAETAGVTPDQPSQKTAQKVQHKGAHTLRFWLGSADDTPPPGAIRHSADRLYEFEGQQWQDRGPLSSDFDQQPPSLQLQEAALLCSLDRAARTMACHVLAEQERHKAALRLADRLEG